MESAEPLFYKMNTLFNMFQLFFLTVSDDTGRVDLIKVDLSRPLKKPMKVVCDNGKIC